MKRNDQDLVNPFLELVQASGIVPASTPTGELLRVALGLALETGLDLQRAVMLLKAVVDLTLNLAELALEAPDR